MYWNVCFIIEKNAIKRLTISSVLSKENEHQKWSIIFGLFLGRPVKSLHGGRSADTRETKSSKNATSSTAIATFRSRRRLEELHQRLDQRAVTALTIRSTAMRASTTRNGPRSPTTTRSAQTQGRPYTPASPTSKY